MSDWPTDVVFGWPQFEDWEDGLRVSYAARDCSLAWERAIETETISELGVSDFALAVFDKADELNSFIRQICSQFNSPSLTPEGWFREIKVAINYAHKLCYAIVEHVFPDTPLLAQFADPDIIQPFVRSAIASVWESGKDSRGVYPPECEPYERSWVDKYIPRPETLHLRAWTSIDPYDPAAPMEVIWVNYKGEVEKYELIEQDDSGSVESITKTIEEQEKDYLSVVPEQNEDEDEDEGEGEDEARSATETSKTPINTAAVANAAVHGAQRPKVSSHSKGATNTPITSPGRLPPSQTEGSSCSRSPLRERRQIPSGTPSGSSRAKPHTKTNTKTNTQTPFQCVASASQAQHTYYLDALWLFAGEVAPGRAQPAALDA